MAKGTKTPRGKRGHRSKSPAVTTQPKRRRVIKQKKKITVKETLHKTRKHGMKTRANAQQPDHADCNVQNSQLIEDERPQPPSTPKTPHTSNSIWHLLNPYRSFWDLIKISYDDTNGSKSSTPKEDDIQAIMDRLNRQVSHQFDSYKYEDSGFFSSSPSGDDPRDEMPVDEAEVDDLRVAIWPTLQHVAELTKSHPLVPDPEDDYLTQLRYVREQLRDTWQNKGFPGNPPPTFQLEAWNGGIANVSTLKQAATKNFIILYLCSSFEERLTFFSGDHPSIQMEKTASQLPMSRHKPKSGAQRHPQPQSTTSRRQATTKEPLQTRFTTPPVTSSGTTTPALPSGIVTTVLSWQLCTTPAATSVFQPQPKSNHTKQASHPQ